MVLLSASLWEVAVVLGAVYEVEEDGAQRRVDGDARGRNIKDCFFT